MTHVDRVHIGQKKTDILHQQTNPFYAILIYINEMTLTESRKFTAVFLRWSNKINCLSLLDTTCNKHQSLGIFYFGLPQFLFE